MHSHKFWVRLFYCLPLVILVVMPAPVGSAENPFAEFVRKSEPLTPEQEQKTFHLPPGFEIQLVASEPEIGKPMNMAFDARGRLWLTQSREYPFAAPTNRPARDKIMVLENLDANARAQKVTTFAEGLNVPIGLYPYKNGCIAFSIPNIYFFEDTDGDGKADKKEKILGEFGFNKDLHGLTSSFRRGFDGWIYADHGFKNDSTLTAKDGSQITLNSGNTYRFKPDGSQVEQHSHGQVNPFGLMFDPLGDLWASDCHSAPVYVLLRGAYYPSFGKPDDGLGFAPNICDHSHGSTAIAGMVFYAATNFPAEFQNNTLIGNVMTCRINRDSYAGTGSTRMAKEEPDFLSCDDPWFRPVDLQLGPDGAIYVADFYNRIIGHYEVPLDHPGRDRERGRIWRIVYKGAAASTGNSVPLVLPGDVNGLIAELGDSNITRRMLAMSELTDRIGEKAIGPLKAVFKHGKAASPQKVQALWALQRLGALDEDLLASAAQDPDRDVRVHAMRMVGEMPAPTLKELNLAATGTLDPDAYVQRAAAGALGRHPDFANLKPLLNLREKISDQDSELLHVARIALRDNLASSNNFARVTGVDLSEPDSRALADVSVGIQTPGAGEFLIKHIQKFPENRRKLETYLRHAARFAPAPRLSELASFTRKSFADDLDFQVALFKSTAEGLAQRGLKMDASLADWGADLAERLIAKVDPDSIPWRNTPIKNENAPNPWVIEKRVSSDGDKDSQFISSFAMGGEDLTGVLRSQPFTIPDRLSFFIAGYDGSPDRPLLKKNFIRLRSTANHKILAEARPPVSDFAKPETWDLKKFAGKQGYLEIVDGNGGHVAAWLAVGRFNPPVVPLPAVIPNQLEKRPLLAAELAAELHLIKLTPRLLALLDDENAGQDARIAAVKALAVLNPETSVSNIAKVFSDTKEPEKLREAGAQMLAKINSKSSRSALVTGMIPASHPLQKQIALALAANRDGAEELLQAVEQGKVPAHVLQEAAVTDRLTAAKPGNLNSRLEKLTKNLSPISGERQKLIDARRAAFAPGKASPQKGAKIFAATCAVCHSINSRGGNIGPQLDGVGNRGADRIIEDILDPNRNVDPAFYYSNVTLKDDTVLTGLFRREEGALVVFADATGKEISIPKAEIVERRQSQNSLMPDNFGELISPGDFNDLLSYLLSTGSKNAAK
jgi:putative heme-binding domain-containing protein